LAKTKTLRFRDTTLSPGFTQIQNIVLRDGELSPGDKIMYALLLSYAWQQSECFPGQKQLSEDMGCNSRTVRRHIGDLIARGLITEERRGLSKTNKYTIEPLGNVYSEVDGTEMSAQESAEMSTQDGTDIADKEYPVEEDSIKKKQMLSRNPEVAEMQSYLGFPHISEFDPVPNPAKEAMFIKKMKGRGFAWPEIFATWQNKVDARHEFVSMQWVNEDIGKESGRGKHRGDTGDDRRQESIESAVRG